MVAKSGRVFLIGILIICVQISKYESINVSPKLDFVESNEDAVVKDKSSPKIQGVRVVVDTSQLKKSVESKSMEEDDEEDDDESSGGDSKAARKKTVGVRTDITIEISDEDGDEGGNKTRKQKKKSGGVVDKLDDDYDEEGGKDRRVPVITGSSTGGGVKIDQGAREPEQKWHVQSVPVFHGLDNRRRSDGGLDGERWDNRIPPIGVWTTEPNYYMNPRPRAHISDPTGFKPIIPNNPWKPCRCHESNVPNYHWKPSALKPRTFVVPLERYPKSHGVNDKLEFPFSNSESDEY